MADVTYMPTWGGFLYLAVVLDVWSRRIVGWAMAAHLRTELVVEALDMALWQRRPAQCHASLRSWVSVHRFRLRRAVSRGRGPALHGSVGDCYDNAMCESFFATLECELIDRTCFPTHTIARREIFEFIEGWYNPHPGHLSNSILLPLGNRPWQDHRYGKPIPR